MTVERDYIDAQLESVKETIEALERHHGQLHTELQRALDNHESAQAERVKVALDAIDRRLDGMNEFRKSLEDVATRAVSRDLFDVVTNRLTVVENTYLRKSEYGTDGERIRERMDSDIDAIKDIITERAERNADRISALEKSSVRQEGLNTVSTEAARTRKALTYSIIGGVILVGINLIINLIQASGGTP